MEMKKLPGFTHEEVVRWKSRYRSLMHKLDVPPRVYNTLGDIEQRISGYLLYKEGGVELKWRPPEPGDKQLKFTVKVESVSRENHLDYPFLVWLRKAHPMFLDENIRYFEIFDSHHSCHLHIYDKENRKMPMFPGPDHHEIAAIYFLQDEFSKWYSVPSERIEFFNMFTPIPDDVSSFYVELKKTGRKSLERREIILKYMKKRDGLVYSGETGREKTKFIRNVLE